MKINGILFLANTESFLNMDFFIEKALSSGNRRQFLFTR